VCKWLFIYIKNERTYVDGWAELGMIFACIFALAVPFWVVNVFGLEVVRVRTGRVGKVEGYVRVSKHPDDLVLLQIHVWHTHGPRRNARD